MSKLLPYETIVKAHEGDPEAVNAVLRHYAGYIRYFSKVNGQVNAEVEDYVKQRLIDCQFNYPGASTQALCSAPTSPLTALAFRSCSRKRKSGVCEFVCLCFYI